MIIVESVINLFIHNVEKYFLKSWGFYTTRFLKCILPFSTIIRERVKNFWNTKYLRIPLLSEIFILTGFSKHFKKCTKKLSLWKMIKLTTFSSMILAKFELHSWNDKTNQTIKHSQKQKRKKKRMTETSTNINLHKDWSTISPLFIVVKFKNY